MEASETAALRNLLDRYLSGHEPLDAAAPRFVSLRAAWYEADRQATLRGEPALADFLPPNLTRDQQRRMMVLRDAASDLVPGPDIVWLPVDEDEAVL